MSKMQHLQLIVFLALLSLLAGCSAHGHHRRHHMRHHRRFYGDDRPSSQHSLQQQQHLKVQHISLNSAREREKSSHWESSSYGDEGIDVSSSGPPNENSNSNNIFTSAKEEGDISSRWNAPYSKGPTETQLNNTVMNVTAQVGGDAFLPCRVGHLGDRQISWIRRRDWHVLTSGNVHYTTDQRFSVLHEPGTQDWTLHVKWVTTRDNGTYECQVSTGTGYISLFVNLSVLTPEARIPGHGQYHVNRGSPISLMCIIVKSPTPPQHVLWYHNDILLNFRRNKPEVQITSEIKSKKGGLISRLWINHAEDRHSGNYTCTAPNTLPASTLVFVTEGDKTAAVQRIDSGAFKTSVAASLCTLSFVIIVLLALR